MKIEQHWEDCVIYLVGFIVVDKFRSTNVQQITRKIHKTIVLDTHDEGEVKKIIKERFSDVKKIEYIDTWSDEALKAK